MAVLDTVPVDLALLVEGGLLIRYDEVGDSLLRVPDLACTDAHVIFYNPQDRCRASDGWVEESTFLNLNWQRLLRLVVELIEGG